MIERTDNRPWMSLAPSVAAPLRPRVKTLVGEVIDAVQAAVPEYRRLDPAVSRGVEVALDGFLDLVEGGDETRLPGRDVYVRFGQAEARNGRSLAEAIFAYIDEISAASAEGHAREQSLAAREQAERRRRLMEALLRGEPDVGGLAGA